MAVGEMPLAAASLLNSSSQAGKLPPQVAASAGSAGASRTAPAAQARKRRRRIIGVIGASSFSFQEMTGRTRMSGSPAAKTRLDGTHGSMRDDGSLERKTAGRPATGGSAASLSRRL